MLDLLFQMIAQCVVLWLINSLMGQMICCLTMVKETIVSKKGPKDVGFGLRNLLGIKSVRSSAMPKNPSLY